MKVKNFDLEEYTKEIKKYFGNWETKNVEIPHIFGTTNSNINDKQRIYARGIGQNGQKPNRFR